MILLSHKNAKKDLVAVLVEAGLYGTGVGAAESERWVDGRRNDDADVKCGCQHFYKCTQGA